MRAIVLEGGGAKGSFQVGAMKAIKECQVEYDMVVGASIGSINGAIIAMGDVDLLEKMWLSAEAKDLIKGDAESIQQALKLDFSGDPKKMREALLETFKQGGIDVSPFRKLLRDYVDEDKLRQSTVHYGLVTLSLSDLKPIEVFVEDIPEGKLHDYIIASSNFPAFKQERIDNKVLIDGGVFDNLPINMALAAGADEVLAIRIHGLGLRQRIKNKDNAKIVMVEPSEDLGGTLEFDPNRAAYNIRLGYYDTLKVLKAYHGEYFYITDMISEETALKRIGAVPLEHIQQISVLLGINNLTYRSLYESILPLIAEILKLPDEASYADLMLAYYEFLAKEAQMERFKLYTFDELRQAVMAYYLQDENDLLNVFIKQIVAIISTKGVSFLPQKWKTAVMIEIYRRFFQKAED